MSDLCWINDSSYPVSWFIITALGSTSDVIKPGARHLMPNNPDILQVGMHVTDGKIYVIQNLKSNCASELIAADIIPFGSYD
jgi:hypothetical protein